MLGEFLFNLYLLLGVRVVYIPDSPTRGWGAVERAMFSKCSIYTFYIKGDTGDNMAAPCS